MILGVNVEQALVLQHEVLTRVALHSHQQSRDTLVLLSCGCALVDHRAALRRELAELEHRVRDGQQQRQRDQPESHQSQPQECSWTTDSHDYRLRDPATFNPPRFRPGACAPN